MLLKNPIIGKWLKEKLPIYIYIRDRMSLFNYGECSMCKVCKVHKNDIKTALNQLFPASVCNIIFEYNSECLKCQWMKDKEKNIFFLKYLRVCC